MDHIAKQVKKKLQAERSKVIDDIVDEYPSCNSAQVEDEADRRMLDSYLNAFIKSFQTYMHLFYHLKCSKIYQTIIDLKDDAMVEYEEEHEMTDEKEFELLLKAIEDNRELYEKLFI